MVATEAGAEITKFSCFYFPCCGKVFAVKNKSGFFMKTALSIAVLMFAVLMFAACDGGNKGATNKAGVTDCVLDAGTLDACTLN